MRAFDSLYSKFRPERHISICNDPKPLTFPKLRYNCHLRRYEKLTDIHSVRKKVFSQPVLVNFVYFSRSVP